MPNRARSALLVGGLALACALTACSGDDAAPSTAPPTIDEPAPALWNPCDGLDLDAVSTSFRSRLTVARGTEQAPQCTFTPARDGGPAIDVNYQLFEGTLEDIVSELPEPGKNSEITSPTLPRADEARLLVSVDKKTLAITGFVQNGPLVQVINVLDPAPYARPRLLAATEEIMRSMAAHAAQNGVTDDAPYEDFNSGH